MQSKYLSLMVGLVLLCSYGCTENPIGEDAITGGARQIRGQVRLSNDLSPENVYVWLEGFNLGTRTDAQGNFQLTLPIMGSQGNSNGVSGAFNIFYFLENFRLERTPVFVRDGTFLYSVGEVNSEGRLNRPKFLSRKLEVETRVQPESASISALRASKALLRIDVYLQAVNNSVIVFFPGIVGDTRGPLFFRNMATDEIFIKPSAVVELVQSAVDTIDSAPARRTMIIELTPDLLPPGKYEVLPYLLVRDVSVPPQLIESLGLDVESLGPEYLYLPMKREGNRFFTMMP